MKAAAIGNRRSGWGVGIAAILSIMLLNGCGPGVAPLKPRPIPKPVPQPAPHAQVPQQAPVTVATEDAEDSRAPTLVRIALSLGDNPIKLAASGGEWSFYDRDGDRLLMHAEPTEVWTATLKSSAITLKRGSETKTVEGRLIVRSHGSSAFVMYRGKRYRGELILTSTGGSIAVINRLPVESYLRGVVPLEIGGDRPEDEVQAVRAQAVAARSFTYNRLNPSAPYDMTGTVSDQAYGGVDAERPVSDAAIAATRHQVLMYNGKVVSAPYHSNSGGCTAAPSEVWHGGDFPYLVPVKDTVGGTNRFYCEDAPRFRWSRTFDAATLHASLNKYLRKYARGPKGKGSIKHVKNITLGGRTASGRVSSLTFETNRGKYTVSGDRIRFVLRTRKGAILPSTLFSFETKRRRGNVISLSIQGTGNGHGVGMDQWGAIARSRAGQDYRTILSTYYPGTTIDIIS